MAGAGPDILEPSFCCLLVSSWPFYISLLKILLCAKTITLCCTHSGRTDFKMMPLLWWHKSRIVTLFYGMYQKATSKEPEGLSCTKHNWAGLIFLGGRSSQFYISKAMNRDSFTVALLSSFLKGLSLAPPKTGLLETFTAETFPTFCKRLIIYTSKSYIKQKSQRFLVRAYTSFTAVGVNQIAFLFTLPDSKARVLCLNKS